MKPHALLIKTVLRSCLQLEEAVLTIIRAIARARYTTSKPALSDARVSVGMRKCFKQAHEVFLRTKLPLQAQGGVRVLAFGKVDELHAERFHLWPAGYCAEWQDPVERSVYIMEISQT